MLIFVLISSLGFSQQVLMKRSSTQFSFLCLANGNSLTNLCGSNNFNTIYDNYYIALQYESITVATSNQISVTVINETINSINFNWLNPGIEYTNTAITNPNPLAFVVKSVWTDCNNDGFKDALYIIINFPMTQTNGSSIPVGQQIRFNSPILNDAISNTMLLDGNQRWFEWDGIQWNQSSIFGSYPTVNQNWETNFLSINNIIKSTNKDLIYPNPSNNFIKVQNVENITEELDYEIVDFLGRIVKNGKSKFNEQINIESLTSGNYIIQIETTSGKKITEKLIKN